MVLSTGAVTARSSRQNLSTIRPSEQRQYLVHTTALPQQQKTLTMVIIRCPHLAVTKFHIQISVEIHLGNKQPIVPTSANNTSIGLMIAKSLGTREQDTQFLVCLCVGSMLVQISIKSEFHLQKFVGKD